MVSRNKSSNYRRPLPPLPPPRPLPPLDNERPNATPPRPLLAKLTAFRTFKSLSSVFGFLIFLLSLSIFARRFNEVLFSFSMGVSVGSNYFGKDWRQWLEDNPQNIKWNNTFRLTPRIFFSPSSRLSNLPMLAVLVRVMARVFSISSFRCWRGLAARAIFCWCLFSFFAILPFLSSRATFRGS